MCRIVITLESIQQELRDFNARLVRLCQQYHDQHHDQHQHFEHGRRYLMLTRKNLQELASLVDQYLRDPGAQWQLSGEWKLVTNSAGKIEYAQALVRAPKPDCSCYLLPDRDAPIAKNLRASRTA